MTRPEPNPLATNAVKRVLDAAEHGGRVTSVEVASLAAEVLRHRRDQRTRIRRTNAEAAAVSANGSAKRSTPASRFGPRPLPPPSVKEMERAIEAYLGGATLAETAELMSVSASVGRRLLVEAGVEIRKSGWKR